MGAVYGEVEPLPSRAQHKHKQSAHGDGEGPLLRLFPLLGLGALDGMK